MAGDWLKVEVCTPDKPEIWQIAQDLNIDPDAAFGKLFRLWAWFDTHTENGNAPSVSKSLIDRAVGVTGFSESVILAGWMSESEGILTLPHFDRHNGKTAKNRALTAKRVAKHKANEKVTSEALPREEKRRVKEKVKKESSRKKFTPPTVEEVANHVKEKKYNIDPEAFVNFYTSKGWMVGKSPMKDWKAAANNWHRNSKPHATSNQRPIDNTPTIPAGRNW